MSLLKTKLIWRALRGAYRPMQGAPERVDDALLEEVEAEVRAVLKRMPPFAARSFALPEALKDFYRVAQDVLEPKRAGESFAFYAPTWLATDGLHLADEAKGDSTPWVEIGSFDENTWAFICCDTEDPLFGTVVERRDATPWSQLVWEDEVHVDMTAFLGALADL